MVDERTDEPKPLSNAEVAALMEKWADVLDIPSGPFVNEDLRLAAARIRELEAERDSYRDLAGETQTKWALKWQGEKQRAEKAEAELESDWPDWAKLRMKNEKELQERAEKAEAERDAMMKCVIEVKAERDAPQRRLDQYGEKGDPCGEPPPNFREMRGIFKKCGASGTQSEG